jgi:hypothetical protein
MEVSGHFHAPAVLLPGKGFPGSHFTEGYEEPRNGLDAVEKRKIYCPCRESSPDFWAVQPIAHRYTDWDLQIK